MRDRIRGGEGRGVDEKMVKNYSFLYFFLDK